MTHFSTDKLLQRLQAVVDHSPSRYWVAFSGGLDSTVLLHALVEQRAALAAPLAAVHVNHNLQAGSAAWAAHCLETCAALNVPLEIFEVAVALGEGASPEAAARDARYDAFRELLVDDEVLLTAHHQDDQAETFLLQALRGAGLPGLAAMPAAARLGRGQVLRPLLDWPRAQLLAWAEARNLHWLDDPSNRDARFDRNFLRQLVMPLLAGRWPAAVQTLSRAARHAAEAAELVDTLAASDLSDCSGGDQVLDVVRLRQLDPARRRNVLRHWLDWLGFSRPSEKKLEHILVDVLEASPDGEPCVSWGEVAVRRYRNRLYAERETGEPRSGDWIGETFALGDGLGLLRKDAGMPGGLPEAGRVEIRFRDGGERLRPEGRQHHHELKKLFQEAGVLPWRRSVIPLVYVDNELAAVGDLWLNADLVVAGGWRIGWDGAPRLLADEATPNSL